MKNYYNPITVVNGNRKITISLDTITAATATVNTNRKIYNIVKLSHNSNYVLKYNKTCISTYNPEFLAAYIAGNDDAFNNLFTFITLHELIESVTNFAKINNLTISAFYNSYNDNIDTWIDLFKSCSNESRRIIINDHVCYDHDAKMKGIISLSTYVGNNIYCLARCNNCPGAICQYCYADSLTTQRYYLKAKLIRIMAILTNIELCADDIPHIDNTVYPYFRFESFGDLNNTIQVNNYNIFAAVNPKCNFTLWTKNPHIIQTAINKGMTKANNLIVGLSSLYLNKPDTHTAKRYPFIRFLFTVYDDNYIKEHNININCGGRHCIPCGICYDYLHEYKTGLYIINERKK